MSEPAPLFIGLDGLSKDDESLPGWAVDDIVGAGLRMDRMGWVPATAGNLSLRLTDHRIAITRGGRHKGELTPDEIMLVNAAGDAIDPDLRPSAETALHCQIYELVAQAGAVVHGHSVAATVLTMATSAASIAFTGYEVLKAFGPGGPAAVLELPILDNDQDVTALAAKLAPLLPASTPLGYAIRGHGVYAWGPDMPSAMARLEALEFLLSCELERRKLPK